MKRQIGLLKLLRKWIRNDTTEPDPLYDEQKAELERNRISFEKSLNPSKSRHHKER